MKHDKTFDNNGEFDLAAYFAQLRRQYAQAKADGFAPLEPDKASERAKACIDMTTGQMRDQRVML